jgi:hypothetical protein
MILPGSRTVDKVSMAGSNFLDEIQDTVPLENLPDLVEGGLKGPEPPFDFDPTCFVFSDDAHTSKAAAVPRTVFSSAVSEATEGDDAL